MIITFPDKMSVSPNKGMLYITKEERLPTREDNKKTACLIWHDLLVKL